MNRCRGRRAAPGAVVAPLRGGGTTGPAMPHRSCENAFGDGIADEQSGERKTAADNVVLSFRSGVATLLTLLGYLGRYRAGTLGDINRLHW